MSLELWLVLEKTEIRLGNFTHCNIRIPLYLQQTGEKAHCSLLQNVPQQEKKWTMWRRKTNPSSMIYFHIFSTTFECSNAYVHVHRPEIKVLERHCNTAVSPRSSPLYSHGRLTSAFSFNIWKKEKIILKIFFKYLFCIQEIGNKSETLQKNAQSHHVSAADGTSF